MTAGRADVADRVVDEPAPAPVAAAPAGVPGAVVLARGELISHEHASSGS